MYHMKTKIYIKVDTVGRYVTSVHGSIVNWDEGATAQAFSMETAKDIMVWLLLNDYDCHLEIWDIFHEIKN